MSIRIAGRHKLVLSITAKCEHVRRLVYCSERQTETSSSLLLELHDVVGAPVTQMQGQSQTPRIALLVLRLRTAVRPSIFSLAFLELCSLDNIGMRHDA